MDQARLLKIRSGLEVATNIAVLLVSVIVLGSFAWNYFSPTPTVLLQTGLQKGAAFAQVPGVDYKTAPQTLIIAMSADCDYCSQSIPFYKQLAELENQRSKGIPIIALFPDGDSQMKQYLQEHQFTVKAISKVDFKALNVAATPTTVLVDSNGKILDFWVGKPSKDFEQQITKAVNGTGT
jgi:thioredoxin-related protein